MQWGNSVIVSLSQFLRTQLLPCLVTVYLSFLEFTLSGSFFFKSHFSYPNVLLRPHSYWCPKHLLTYPNHAHRTPPMTIYQMQKSDYHVLASIQKPMSQNIFNYFKAQTRASALFQFGKYFTSPALLILLVCLFLKSFRVMGTSWLPLKKGISIP